MVASTSAWGDEIDKSTQGYQPIGASNNVQNGGTGKGDEREAICCGFRRACCGNQRGTYCCGRLYGKGCAVLSTFFFLTFGAFMLVGVYVIGPEFAQHTLDNANIEFQKMVIGEVNEEGTSFQSTVKALLSNVGSIDANVASMKMDMYYQDIIVGSVTLPEVVIIGGKDSEIESTSNFTIVNQTNFVRFSADMIRLDSLELGLKGVCDLEAKVGLKITFKELIFDKTVKLTGLGGLKGVEILQFDPSVSDKDNVKCAITAKLPNPSIVEMTDVGDLNFEVWYEGQHLGRMISPQASVHSGDNILNMTGYIKPDKPDDPAVVKGLSLLLGGKPVAMQAIGADHLASTIPLFAPAFKGLVINTTVVNPFKPLITKVDMQHVEMTLHADGLDTIDMSFTAAVTIDSPLGPDCPIDVKTVQLATTIWYLDDNAQTSISAGGVIDPIQGAKQFGLSSTPIARIQDGSKSTFTFSMKTQVNLTDRSVFGSFAEGFILKNVTYMAMQGASVVSMQTPAGLLTAKDLPFQNVVEMAALDNLKDVELEMLNLYLMGGDKENGLQAEGQLKMNNPTKVSLDLGSNSDLFLDIYYKGQVIGFSKISQFILNEGDNINLYPMSMNLIPGSNLVQGMLSDYLCGKDSPVVVKARKSAIPYLAQMLSHMVLPTVVRGSPANLIPGAIMYKKFIPPINVPTQLLAYNPFNTTMSIIAYDTKVYWLGKMIGYAKNDKPAPIVLPPFKTTKTQKIIIYPKWSLSVARALWNALTKGAIPLTMEGMVTVQVGTFAAAVYYDAPNIDAVLG